MAGGLNSAVFLRAPVTVVAGAAAAMLAGHALAQVPMADPTRPPPALEAASSVAADGTARANVAPPAGLQAIIRRPGRKPVAVINGETVELGGKVGEATLVSLGDAEAILQGAQGKETLRLTPTALRLPAGKLDQVGSVRTERVGRP